MSISSLNLNFTGQTGVNPRLIRLVCDDAYSTVIAENYLQQAVKLSGPLSPTDFIFASYSGGHAIFTPNISGGNITLVPLPLDGGVTPSDPTKPKVASVNGATTIGEVATFSDVNGTIHNGGVLLSALQLSANIKANTASYAGGATSTTFTLTGATTSTIINCWIVNSSNAAFVESSKVLSANTVTVTFNADPGASTVIGYIAFIAPQ